MEDLKVQRKTNQSMNHEFYDVKIVKAASCRVIPDVAYMVNDEIEKLDKIVKRAVRRDGFRRKQSGDE